MQILMVKISDGPYSLIKLKGYAMYYKIPGSDCLINNKYDIIKIVNDEVIRQDLFNNKNKIKIELYGKEILADPEWVYTIAKEKIHFTDEYGRYIFNIKIRKQNTKYNKHTVFRDGNYIYMEPNDSIFINKIEYKFIINYPYYAISKDGNVINLRNGNIIRPVRIKNNKLYPHVTLINSDGKRFTTAIHRLLALAWLLNNDVYNNIFVDHIDGNKNNFSLSNLRWVTPKANSLLAFKQNLRNDNKKIIVYNIDTKDKIIAHSLAEACSHMKRSRMSSKDSTLDKLGRAIIITNTGRFEIRYTDIEDDFYRPEDIIRIKNREKKYILAKKIATGEIVKFKTLSEASKELNILSSNIIKSIRYNGAYAFNEWVFKYDDNNEFAKLIDIRNKAKHYVIIYNNGKRKIFNSMREISKFLNIDRKTFIKYLERGYKFNNAFTIREIDSIA